MMTSGVRVNGKLFTETFSSGMKRYTRRYFINGKMTAKKEWFAQFAIEKAIEAKKEKKELA